MKNKASIFVFNRLSLVDRKKMFENIRHQLPKYIPLIVELHSNDLNETQFMKKPLYKLLVEPNKNLSYVTQLIRKEIQSDQGIFLLVNGIFSISLTTPLSSVYEQYKDEDGFLYISYSNEMIWGEI